MNAKSGHSKVPQHRDRRSTGTWTTAGQIFAAIIAGSLFGFVGWAAASYLGASDGVAVSVAALPLLAGILLGWRYWTTVIDSFIGSLT